MADKSQKIADFDPNGVGAKGRLFGLPFNFEESEVVVFPVPWDVTTSYRPGTSMAPEAIMEASAQVDLYDTDLQDAWQHGIYMLENSQELAAVNKKMRVLAHEVIRYQEQGHDIHQNKRLTQQLQEVNQNCQALHKWVQEQTKVLLDRGKMICLLGGDHSTPLGYLKALSAVHDNFGILQIDAHADLREAYEGFTWSHASIFYNALAIEQVSKLVQVGLRDVCEAEMKYIHNHGRVSTYFYHTLTTRQMEGETWQKITADIIQQLPQKVYISFDIDGLDPKLCPNTGTPVPGGFELDSIIYLFRQLVASGREIIGCDLCEVNPGHDDWDANVGARLLYKMCNLMLKSRLSKD